MKANELKKELEKVAEKLGISYGELQRTVHSWEQDECDEMDVRQWLADHDVEYTNEVLDKVIGRYQSHYDSEYGTWDNISAAYYYVVGEEALGL